MNSLSAIGKYLDQPIFIGKFAKAVPLILIAGGVGYTYNHVRRTPPEEKQKELIKSVIVLFATISSALIAPKAALKITKKFFKSHKHTHVHGAHCNRHHHEHGHGSPIDLEKIKEKTKILIENFIRENKIPEKARPILNKAKKDFLSFVEIKTLFNELKDNPSAKKFLSGKNGLIPDPENIDSKHIFEEIGRISVLGAFPVLGGIAGGVIADKLTEKNWKEKFSDKIKEGSYQYIANIFLCNIGAGAALAMMEKANIKSKPARAIGMITGIFLAGLVFGSAVANLIGKIFIDPLFDKKEKNKPDTHLHIYSERKPEALDAGLHIDDVATVAVMSGLKWIEPALPILYSISGYRAGIGYRNNHHN